VLRLARSRVRFDAPGKLTKLPATIPIITAYPTTGCKWSFVNAVCIALINTNGQTHIVTATMTAKKQPSFGNRCISRSRRDCMVTAGRSDLDILFAFVPIGPFAAGYSRPSRPVTNVYVSSTRAKSRDGNHMPTCLIVPESMREIPERYVDVLREAGFDIAIPRIQNWPGTSAAKVR